ncbi:PREDICTED: cysteine-rich protein 3 isoform X2 [Chinchilla lanigera]|uniref:cysteine-rich protein 3 isoform X2 n=1 Tax=Chinchilla lanigera TaxID=34839 RepID=UPI000697ED93|nr:PREDICTED: cysteine-rich protein 3 isoform X2 [Chinchilla lanigera]
MLFETRALGVLTAQPPLTTVWGPLGSVAALGSSPRVGALRPPGEQGSISGVADTRGLGAGLQRGGTSPLRGDRGTQPGGCGCDGEAMSWSCPRCHEPVYFAEKVSSLGKNWHRFCLKCERCHTVLSPGGHAEWQFCQHTHCSALPGPDHLGPSDPLPSAVPSTKGGPTATSHATGPSLDPEVSTSLGGPAARPALPCPALPEIHQSGLCAIVPAGVNIGGVGSYLYNSPTASPASTTLSPSSFSPPRPRTGLPCGKKSLASMRTFTGETSLCPGCGQPVFFAEKVMSLGRNWHRPCLRCQRCQKTLTAGSHAEV